MLAEIVAPLSQNLCGTGILYGTTSMKELIQDIFGYLLAYLRYFKKSSESEILSNF